MKRLFLTLALVLLVVDFTASSVAQTQHVTLSGSVVGFAGGGQASPASLVSGDVQLTQRVSIGYEQIIEPALDANYYLGDVKYTLPLASLVGKRVNSHFVFDSSKWVVQPIVGVGVLRQSNPVVGAPFNQHVATTAGAGLIYTANDHVGLMVAQVQWLHSSLLGNQFFVTPDANAIQVATGIQVKF